MTYYKNKNNIDAILNQGSLKARELASAKLVRLRKIVGLG